LRGEACTGLDVGLASQVRTPTNGQIGAAIACHRADVEDLLYGGYGDTGSPAAPSTTWIWKANWPGRLPWPEDR
jgi:hypothetical protein